MSSISYRTKAPTVKIVLLLIGLGLFGLNISSLFISLRHPDLYKEKTFFENDITLSEKEVFNTLNQEYLSDEEYIVSVNAAINQGIAHYWGDEVKKYHLSIPLYENYVLYAATHLLSFFIQHVTLVRNLFNNFRDPMNIVKKYEFSDYRKAIERGIGLCSQHAVIITQVLKKRGIDSKIVYLDGHVVAMAQVNVSDDMWWVMDADYGVIVKHDIETIENTPKRIVPYYREKGYSETVIKGLTEVYASAGNRIYETVAEYHGRDRWYKYYVESFLYLLKWLIPVGLLLPGGIQLMKRRQHTG